MVDLYAITRGLKRWLAPADYRDLVLATEKIVTGKGNRKRYRHCKWCGDVYVTRKCAACGGDQERVYRDGKIVVGSDPYGDDSMSESSLPFHTIKRCRPSHRPALYAHIRKWTGCKQCPLGRQQIPVIDKYTFYRGFVPCEVLFVGEAPGGSENTWGTPFLGPTGQLLQRIINESSVQAYGRLLGYTFALTNTVACFPRATGEKDAGGLMKFRPPVKDEIEACSGRLNEFIRICEPKILVSVGAVAEKALLKRPTGIRMLAIRHPSFMEQAKDRELEISKAIVALRDGLKRNLKT